MKVCVRGFLCLMLFLPFLSYSLSGNLEQLLKRAPESPSLLHEHSYIPEMNVTKKAEASDEEGAGEKEALSNDKIKPSTTDDKDSVGFKKPSFVQILLISFVVVILIVHRLRLRQSKP